MSGPSAAEERRWPPRGRDDGSAVVDTVLVGALTTLLFASVLQLGFALHVRATLIDCAAEGARYGAMADRDPGEGAARAADLIGMSLASVVRPGRDGHPHRARRPAGGRGRGHRAVAGARPGRPDHADRHGHALAEVP